MTTILGGALALTLPLAAQPAYADLEVPVDVMNGTFARPRVADTPGELKWDGETPFGWDGGEPKEVGAAGVDGGGTVSAAAAGRNDGRQAANLHRGREVRSISTRLWEVRKGAQVQIAWEDSPSTYYKRDGWSSERCADNQVGREQTYEFSWGPRSDQKQAFSTKELPGPGEANWDSAKRSRTFTATEDQQRITFTSTTEDSENYFCGPMLANVRASQDPASYDAGVSRTALPPARAYKGNNREKDLASAVSTCTEGARKCTFEVYPWSAHPYFDVARTVDEAAINCTRNAITDRRDIVIRASEYNSLGQNKPTGYQLVKDYKEMLPLIATGFEEYAKYPYSWGNDERKRQITLSIQPGEVTWLELQAARERFEGMFTEIVDTTSNSNVEKERKRLFATFDGPSTGRPDRLYQRSGPLNPVELLKCDKTRPTAITPDNR
ncbi:hypothetical protein [Streptomyces syringium]|uniref:hypothetical protein n=1 Tax=Streptomyces syringium TaxID=76729 RepID=UPI0034334CAC